MRQAARPPRCGTCGRCARCRRWTEPEDAFVDGLVGRYEPSEIATQLRVRFGVARTSTAVTERLKRRGRSRWMQGLSLRDLEHIFGVDHRTILRAWVGAGVLNGDRWSGRGPHPGWQFAREDVEAFVREHVYMLDVSRMQAGHPLTTLARLEARTQAWRSASELAAYLGVTLVEVRHVVQVGLVPHRRRPGAGRHGEICIRSRDFAWIRERLHAHISRPPSADSAGMP
jgi:hypothetical protein